MSLKKNNLEDIKSLYEGIHNNTFEEVETLNEAGQPGAAGAMAARNQRIQAQGQVKSALGQGKGIALQSASGFGQGTKPGQKAFGTQLGGRQGVVVKGGAAGPNYGPRGGGTTFNRAADTVNVGGQTLYKAQKGKDIVYLQSKGANQLFKPGQKPAGSTPPGAPAPGARPAPSRPAGAPPAGAPAGAKVGPPAAPGKPGTPPAAPGKPMSAMDQWRAANPKLAAAADEKARIRGTQQTDNPLMKNMRSGLPMNSPSVQSPAVAKLGAGNQSLTQNPNAFKAAAPATTTQTAFRSPSLAPGAVKAVTPAMATAAAPSTSAAASGSVVPASNALAAQTSAQQAKKPTFGALSQMKPLTQSFEYSDLYDLVIEYLMDDGHAETLDEAAYIIDEMEPAVIADIIEAKYGTAKGRKALAKKVRKGEDVGKPGEGFEKIVNKSKGKYGKKRATKIAAAAMWKNLAK